MRLLDTIKSEDEADASASEKEMDEHGETGTSKATIKGKRKLQTRKGSKLLQLQAKAASDSESDTGIYKIYSRNNHRMRIVLLLTLYLPLISLCIMFPFKKLVFLKFYLTCFISYVCFITYISLIHTSFYLLFPFLFRFYIEQY